MYDSTGKVCNHSANMSPTVTPGLIVQLRDPRPFLKYPVGKKTSIEGPAAPKNRS
jgi:hypothetical protein